MIQDGAMIVGSYATALIKRTSIDNKDLDLVVSPQLWGRVFMHLPPDLAIDTTGFGGLNFKIGDLDVDVWVDTIDNVLQRYQKNGNVMPHVLDLKNRRMYSVKDLG